MIRWLLNKIKKIFGKVIGDIRFYIDDQQVDLEKDPQFYYNWQLTDFSNPTITKNSYSKTIQIEGTKKNNKIFGEIWKLDRTQGYGGNSGINFNPTYRVPFTIYLDGNLFEAGYVKLQKIKYEKGKYTYEIGLFGMMGLFAYNLQTDWNSGEKRTLGDLVYYVDDVALVEPGSNFTIDKDTVATAWNEIDSYSSRWSVINFAPCYNGFNDKMEKDKAVINFSGQTAYPETNVVSGDGQTKNYTSYQGYALATIQKEVQEFEMGDLRSWAQRPCVRVKSVIDAICRPENNRGKYDSGFEVELDPEFFNSRNPYYEDAWMTLPLISSLNITTKGETETPYTANFVKHYSDVDSIELVYALSEPVTKFGSTAELYFDLMTNVPNVSAGTDYDKLYPSAFYNQNGSLLKWTNVYALQGFATTDDSRNAVAIDGTRVLWCQHNREGGSGTLPYTFEMATSKGVKEVEKGLADFYSPRFPTKTANVDEGYFVRYNNTVYRWDHQLYLSVPLPIGTTHFRIRLDRKCNRTKQRTGNMRAYLFARDRYLTEHIGSYLFTNSTLDKNNLISNRSFKTKVGDVNNFFSGQEIKIKDLLNTPFTPADFLFDYCKMFGLYLRKDRYEDKIYIETRNTFFLRNDITDISDRIAYDRGIEITPTLCDAKYYDMQNKFDESGSYKDYKQKYGKVYGEKIINTGWEFDSDTKQLINSNFKGAVQSRANGIYYFEPFTDAMGAYFYDGLTYELYLNGDPSTDDTKEMVCPKMSILDTLNPYIPNIPYYDIDDHPEFCDAEGKALDGSYVLLFRQGDTDVSRAKYYLTDDLNVMEKLTNKPCFLITGCEYDKGGNHIAIKTDLIPHFSRYWISTNYIGSGSTRNNILLSMDFGSPRQVYLLNYVNYEEATLYNQFYSSYYQDMYDVDTRAVTLYFKPDRILCGEDLRRLYWFDNCLWRLNKITDYNPVERELVKCEFVKVNDADSLTNKVPSKELTITVVLSQYSIDGSGGTITATVTTSDMGPWDVEGWDFDDEITISPTSYYTDGTFTITVPAYYGASARTVGITVAAGDLSVRVYFTQTPLEAQQSISITAATPISSAATVLNYSVSANPSGTVYLLSGGTLLNQQNVSGSESKSFAISANNTQSAKTYTLSGVTTDGLHSDVKNVIQNAAGSGPEPPTPSEDYTVEFLSISPDKMHSDIDSYTLSNGLITLLNGSDTLGMVGVNGNGSNWGFNSSVSFTASTSALTNVTMNIDFGGMTWNTFMYPDIIVEVTLNTNETVTMTYSIDGLSNGISGIDLTQYASGNNISLEFFVTVRANV